MSFVKWLNIFKIILKMNGILTKSLSTTSQKKQISIRQALSLSLDVNRVIAEDLAYFFRQSVNQVRSEYSCRIFLICWETLQELFIILQWISTCDLA
jgi:hypothetical protein